MTSPKIPPWSQEKGATEFRGVRQLLYNESCSLHIFPLYKFSLPFQLLVMSLIDEKEYTNMYLLALYSSIFLFCILYSVYLYCMVFTDVAFFLKPFFYVYDLHDSMSNLIYLYYIFILYFHYDLFVCRAVAQITKTQIFAISNIVI